MDKGSKAGLYYIAAAILLPTAVLIVLIAWGTSLSNAFLYGIVAYAVLPPIILAAYFLKNKDPVQRAMSRVPRIIIAFTGVMLAVCVVGMLFTLGSESVSAELNAGDLRVEAPFVDESVPYSDISKVELRSGVSYGSRTAGYAGDSMLSGNYRNNEFGSYKLAVHRSTDECIIVHHNGGTLVFNLDSLSKTERFYLDLMQVRGA